MKQRYKVLFFIENTVPTNEERIAAYAFGPGNCFRCVRFIDPNGALEEADAVYGAVPESYAVLPAAVPIGEWFAAQAAIEAEALAEPVQAEDDAGGAMDPFVSPTPASKPRRGRAWQPNA